MNAPARLAASPGPPVAVDTPPQTAPDARAAGASGRTGRDTPALADTLDDRLAFIGFAAPDRAALHRAAPLLHAALKPAMDGFYARVRATPQMRAMFATDAQMAAARRLQDGHWDRLARAEFDAAHATAARRGGDVHARIGLEPRWYIGGYGVILAAVLEQLVQQRLTGPLGLRRPAADRLAAEIAALVKAVLLDIDLSITSYQDRLDTARQQAEERQTATLAALSGALRQVAQGQLDVDIDPDLAAQSGLAEAVAGLRALTEATRRGAEAIDTGTAEIAASTDDLSRRTESAAASLEQTTAAVAGLTGAVQDTAARARSTREAIAGARGDAEAGGAVVTQAEAAMDRIAGSSRDIGQIITVIDEIAFQTNLLALNAGVEAARAGEAGRGFAVVASEVRALAQRAAEAARDIKTLIDTGAGHVQDGVRLVGEAAAALARIRAAMDAAGTATEATAQAAEAQAASITELNVAIADLDAMTQQNAAMVEQASAATAALAREAAQMTQTVARFRS